MAVTPTWAEHEMFTAELRTRLKASGVLGPGETITAHEPLKWTAAQTRNARNYEPGMIVTFNQAVKGFKAGETSEVARIADGDVFVRARQWRTAATPSQQRLFRCPGAAIGGRSRRPAADPCQ